MKVTMVTLKKLHDALPRQEFLATEHALVSAAWALVAPKEDWRAAVACVVPDLALTDFDAGFICYAVQYFTASPCTAEMMPDGAVRFKAKGYRMGPAGP
jgi:hypothetical protein